MTAILKIENLGKSYRSGERNLTVLDEISFNRSRDNLRHRRTLRQRKNHVARFVCGLDRSSTGDVLINGISLSSLNEDERAAVRNQFVGFVFQNFQLIPTLTALENVMVPMELRGETNVRDTAAELLNRVGLGKRLNHYPVQLSGGEQWAFWRARLSIAPKFYLRTSRPAILTTKPEPPFPNCYFR
ncbi:MAG: ATP-binding cassette domain-containing protein [Calditrichia bacterium]